MGRREYCTKATAFKRTVLSFAIHQASVQSRATTPFYKNDTGNDAGKRTHPAQYALKEKTYEIIVGAARTLGRARLIVAGERRAGDAYGLIERAGRDTERDEDRGYDGVVRLCAYIFVSGEIMAPGYRKGWSSNSRTRGGRSRATCRCHCRMSRGQRETWHLQESGGEQMRERGWGRTLWWTVESRLGVVCEVYTRRLMRRSFPRRAFESLCGGDWELLGNWTVETMNTNTCLEPCFPEYPKDHGSHCQGRRAATCFQ